MPEKPLTFALSLVAQPGQVVAIVGSTWAGKITLVNLMWRFVIAHRLSTIRDAELILVMEAGQR